MSLNIEELFTEFNNDADESKELLRTMLSVITEGRAPSTKAVEALNQSIESLQKKYLSIYSLALAQISSEEMPSDGLAVHEYVEAVHHSALLQYKKQIESIKKTLEEFICVRSLVSHYASALLPYQKEAEELMASLDSEESREVDVLEEQTAGPRAFLKSLYCEDLDSDEGIELLDQVAEHYSHRVHSGLAAGKYFLPKEEIVTAEESETISPADSNTVEEIAETAEKQMEKAAESSEDVQTLAEQDTSTETELSEENLPETEIGEPAPIEEERSVFAQKIVKADVFLSDLSKIGLFSKDISTNEDKKVTTSIFRNDIRRGNEKAVKVILGEIFKNNIITDEFLSSVKKMPDSIATSTLEYLQRKGYLRHYKITPLGDFYCASPKFMKAVTFKDAVKYIGISQRAIEEWGEPIEDTATGAASRIAYEKLYCASIKRFMDDGDDTIAENSSNGTESFISRVHPKGKENECDVNLGIFWSEEQECDSFYEHLEKQLFETDGMKRIVLSAIDKDKAVKLAHILFEEFGERLTAEGCYVYSLSEDAYYQYPSLELVSADSVRSFDAGENDIKENTIVAEEDSSVHKEISVNNEEAEESTSVKAVPTTTNDGETSSDAVGDIKETFVTDALAEENVQISEAVRGTVVGLINRGKIYAATAYAKAASLQQLQHELFYTQLAHAVNDPMAHCLYSTDNVFTLMNQHGDFDDALVVSTALRTFFSNQILYDYNVKSYYEGIKEYGLLRDYPTLSNVLYSLMDFKNTQQKGMDVYADYRTKNQSNLDLEIRKHRQEARMFYDNFVVGQKKEKASQKRFLETKKLILSANSDLGQYIRAIVDSEDELQPLALDFLKEKFYKEDTVIAEDTIDAGKLWEYILVYWEEAGDRMQYRRHSDLMSHLRSNIISITTKAVQLIARWCELVRRKNNQDEDEGDIAYKIVKKSLVENLEKTIRDMTAVCGSDDMADDEEKAGLKILIYTLQEILDCVCGIFIESSRKFYYVPFLLTDDIMLNEDFLPDMDMHSSTTASLMPTGRILDHIQNVQLRQPTYRDRLTEILDDKGDDYGSARLILKYLHETNAEEDFSSIAEAVEAGEAYAKETADLRKDDFIGELELAQSYGQIDNSVEDKKEKILQIIDAWYEWACEKSNYGFFKKVMDSYLSDIKEEAKKREADLLEQLKIFRCTTIPGLSADAKNKRIQKIEGMLKQQNYTVAEDLLARANVSEEEREELIEEDFLKDFLDNYDDYYKPVSQKDKSFSMLVSSRTRNKEERGAKRMAENWLPGGSPLGEDRLEKLLVCFGFKVDTIKNKPAIDGKYEHFHVRTVSAQNGQRANYTHPIAAFGSGAAEEGFRIVCINGNYDADSLIEIMKKIGNAKHTMILYDNALPMSERRKLARKSKNALGDKLICVVDRTVMMFLVRNYDETKNNKMLIALITPFGYYQPYVWESATVMPPEIFMGRKFELEQIKSPTGVNIVYGGRQLGKSALLKKAKEDIDRDENGNRAILVDIKGLDYKKAANKIGHALYDQGILEQDIDTDEWGKLARAVCRRLQSDKDKIPYLLLLLDEADAFIESCGSVNYSPFDALKEIQGIGAGRFKFVIAGLRNIVRFKREALENNSVLTHLQHMTVKPFNTSEARELMEIPLHYLGLRFPKEKESLVTLILATTNYFPGLIQMYCAKLINAMRNKDYANYDEVDTPIYEVSEEHIKKVLADPEFTQQIREKYIITLKLDEDNYYYLIALLMAYLYHNNGYNEGYSVHDIQDVGKELDISKIADLETAKLESFMEELKELNVLRSTDKTHYLFTRFTFFQMMGTRTEVDDRLVEYMED